MTLLLALSGCRDPVAPRTPSPVTVSVTNDSPQPAAPTHTNLLAREKSPYLLQHQHNPVNWYPWGDAAFAKARAENKPIFLSIGYSTCHWCHVMERESFENEDIAALLNEHFVSIKVDREERPDVDKIYMTFVQASTGSGGWPLNVFLTPELTPFYGGTYWPPASRFGRPGFPQVLQQVNEAWQNRREQVLDSSRELHTQLQQFVSREQAGRIAFSAEDLDRAATALKSGYDPRHGGFGSAPKFPTPSLPLSLLQHGLHRNDAEAIHMVRHTCQRMAAGGIYDQLGGGFARYSVDAQWLVPHFEKMLYDNAQLLNLYLDAYLVTGEERMADVARDILRYLLRDMAHPEGGFYSAEDADSEGHEGKFYTWTRAELSGLLTPEEFNVVTHCLGVTQEGNFEDHSHPDPLKGQNVLSLVKPPENAADQALLESAKAKMMKVRDQRVRPHLDDKILASWNGLMLGAVARAGIILGEQRYLDAAEKNCAFLKARLWDAASRTLYHRWRDGERDTVQLQEAYAFLLGGVLDLYEATLNPEHLGFALDLAASMIDRFYDSEAGGFWQSPADAEHLIVRVKEDYDGAEPSGNSAAILHLLRLGATCDRDEFREAALKSLQLFGERLQHTPQAVAYMLQGLDFSLQEPRRLVLVGDPTSDEGRKLLAAAHSVLQRNRVILGTEGPVEAFAKTLPVKDGRATVYVCTGNACQPPTHDAGTVRKQLMDSQEP